MIEAALLKMDDPGEKLRALIEISLQVFFLETGDFFGIMMDFWAEGIRNFEIKTRMSWKFLLRKKFIPSIAI